MNRLPDEVILHILSFLDVQDLIHLQSVSSRYHTLAHDNALWKVICFTHSRAEELRRRQHLLGIQRPRLAELRNAVAALPGNDLTAWDVSQLLGRPQPRASADPATEARVQRSRALANWEPGYPSEDLAYYKEYVQRHAPIRVSWLDLPGARGPDGEQINEAVGLGLLSPANGSTLHSVAPLDDGSVCIWDVTPRSTYRPHGKGTLLAQSKQGLLSGQLPGRAAESRAIMTETGAVECVSIDNGAQKGYFAVQNLLHEVDLNTLQLSSTKQYPWPITALSSTSSTLPLTVGTNLTIHLHDPRDPVFVASQSSIGGELIGGSIYSHATLAQPGPLSILHHSDSTYAPASLSNSPSIWVGGRFTSLLNYDLRFFPRLRGTIHSGARVSCLSSLPYPLIPHSLDLLRNPDATISQFQEARQAAGVTVLAAAEYKGKGSLELYGLPRNAPPYQNRQTASASKLLSVAPHAGTIVFSDGDGSLKWVERNGFSHVRTFNINDAVAPAPSHNEHNPRSAGLWHTTNTSQPGQGDIVQKILPSPPLAQPSSPSTSSPSRYDTPQSSALHLWTGDGRLAILHFSHQAALDDDDHNSAPAGVAADASGRPAPASSQDGAADIESRSKADAERQYGMAMRRVLERNADEVRFVRGLGMGYHR